MMNRPVEVRLLGQKIAFRSKGDPARVDEVVELVSSRIEEIERKFKGNAAPHLVALLALLDLAEEYVAAKERVGRHQAAIHEKAAQIQASLEARASAESGS